MVSLGKQDGRDDIYTAALPVSHVLSNFGFAAMGISCKYHDIYILIINITYTYIYMGFNQELI
jgi:hypothetical protein